MRINSMSKYDSIKVVSLKHINVLCLNTFISYIENLVTLLRAICKGFVFFGNIFEKNYVRIYRYI